MSEYETRHYLDSDGLHIEANLGERSFVVTAAETPMWARDEIKAVAHVQIDSGDVANAYLTRMQAMALAHYLLSIAK